MGRKKHTWEILLLKEPLTEQVFYVLLCLKEEYFDMLEARHLGANR